MFKNKLFIASLLILSLIGGVVFFCKDSLQNYACSSVERSLGQLPLAQEHINKIQSIAKKMSITEPIVFRKMNYRALQLLGYQNAFACFPLLFNIFPVGGAPYMFVSEGFFEDLTPQEQHFIVGHELIHIRERHALYLNLFSYLFSFVLLVLAWFCRKYRMLAILLLCVALIVPEFVEPLYRRSIEREADIESIKLLKSYDGGIALLKRWRSEMGMPLHNPLLGLFASHPSSFEREKTFLEYKNKDKGIIA